MRYMEDSPFFPLVFDEWSRVVYDGVILRERRSGVDQLGKFWMQCDGTYVDFAEAFCRPKCTTRRRVCVWLSVLYCVCARLNTKSVHSGSDLQPKRALMSCRVARAISAQHR